MKVSKVTTTDEETSATIDLFEGFSNLPTKIKTQVQEDVGQYLVEQSLIQISNGKSPVEGETIPALKDGPYKKKKKAEVGSTKADLQFSGETLDELDFRSEKSGLKIGVFGDKAPVMDGHANLSGKSQLPKRRIIPAEGQSYKPSIMKEVNQIVADAIAENLKFDESDFEGVKTQKSLLEVFRSELGQMSKNEISLLVFRSDELVRLLKRLDLLKLLT